MKVLVFSDSHGLTTAMLSVIEAEQPDAVIHLGDCTQDTYDITSAFEAIPLYAVRGNNDWDSREPLTRIIELCGVRLFLSHGHIQYVRQGTDGMLAAAESENCQVALFGHTHVSLKEYRQNILIMNPGSITLPRNRKPSYIRLFLENGFAEGEIIQI